MGDLALGLGKPAQRAPAPLERPAKVDRGGAGPFEKMPGGVPDSPELDNAVWARPLLIR